jgi:hypothetical protein
MIALFFLVTTIASLFLHIRAFYAIDKVQRILEKETKRISDILDALERRANR